MRKWVRWAFLVLFAALATHDAIRGFRSDDPIGYYRERPMLFYALAGALALAVGISILWSWSWHEGESPSTDSRVGERDRGVGTEDKLGGSDEGR